MKWTDFFERQSRTILTAAGAVFVAIVGIADSLTGPDFSLSVFYLVPILMTAWYVGRPAAVALSVLGAAAGLAAKLAGKGNAAHSFVVYWNDVVALIFFLTATRMLTALKSSLEIEKVTARTDHLTRISNRRRFYELAEGEISRHRRYHRPFTIVYVDVDNFKVVNDSRGHSAGDALLQLVAETVRNNIRSTDALARLGGDEFGLLLPESGPEAATAVIRKVQNSLRNAMQSGDWPVTFSIGMVTYITPPANVDEMITAADSLMYAAKSAGKDRVRHEVVEAGAAARAA